MRPLSCLSGTICGDWRHLLQGGRSGPLLGQSSLESGCMTLRVKYGPPCTDCTRYLSVPTLVQDTPGAIPFCLLIPKPHSFLLPSPAARGAPLFTQPNPSEKGEPAGIDSHCLLPPLPFHPVQGPPCQSRVFEKFFYSLSLLLLLLLHLFPLS
ncbi:hypothetical protein LY78DRAFT_150976 [Colletotrichum sublineola]|nr:hypothetical protein LY78DRAFT_150976 [Colletotrichum sublineola]